MKLLPEKQQTREKVTETLCEKQRTKPETEKNEPGKNIIETERNRFVPISLLVGRYVRKDANLRKHVKRHQFPDCTCCGWRGMTRESESKLRKHKG